MAKSHLHSHMHPSTGRITVVEIQDAEMEIFKSVQQHHFNKELQYLRSIEADGNDRIQGKRKSLGSKNSAIQRLDPFIHEDLIRVGERLGNSALSFDAKHPIILPAKPTLFLYSSVVRMLIRGILELSMSTMPCAKEYGF